MGMFTQTFIDEVGREVTFPFPPKRIVSLAPNVTEILFGLGLDFRPIMAVTSSFFRKFWVNCAGETRPTLVCSAAVAGRLHLRMPS